MNTHPPLTWGPKPHCAGLFARVLDCEEAHVMLTSQGWTAYAGSARLTPPIPGPLWASQAEAMDAVARAVGCAPVDALRWRDCAEEPPPLTGPVLMRWGGQVYLAHLPREWLAADGGKTGGHWLPMPPLLVAGGAP